MSAGESLSDKRINLASLGDGMPGLTPACGTTLAESAAVCLEHRAHTVGVKCRSEVKEIKVLHRQALERTDLALAARQKGEAAQALLHFREAYELESNAAFFLTNDFNAEPTRSVLLRSAASLALDCNLILEAEKLICTALIGQPPLEIAEELRDLLEQVHFQRHLALRGISLSAEELQMSIAGKEIGYGISPAEAFLERVGNTEKLLYRTAERKQQKPYRDRGRPDKALQESLKLFMTAPRAASFAVTFRVGGVQLSLPGLSLGEQIIDELLDCLDLFTRGRSATQGSHTRRCLLSQFCGARSRHRPRRAASESCRLHNLPTRAREEGGLDHGQCHARSSEHSRPSINERFAGRRHCRSVRQAEVCRFSPGRQG